MKNSTNTVKEPETGICLRKITKTKVGRSVNLKKQMGDQIIHFLNLDNNTMFYIRTIVR